MKTGLPNGLTVYALEYHEQPVVSLRLMITAGADNDPANVPEWPHLRRIFSTRARKRGRRRKLRSHRQVGGSVEASGDMESTVISASVLTDSVGLAFELMTDVLMNPLLPAELARAQQQSLSNLTANMEDRISSPMPCLTA